jgi:hypothetical protein
MVSWSLTKGVICFTLPVRSMHRIDLVVHVLVNDLFHTSVTPLERIREQKRMKSLPVFPSSGQVRWLWPSLPQSSSHSVRRRQAIRQQS